MTAMLTARNVSVAVGVIRDGNECMPVLSNVETFGSVDFVRSDSLMTSTMHCQRTIRTVKRII